MEYMVMICICIYIVYTYWYTTLGLYICTSRVLLRKLGLPSRRLAKSGGLTQESVRAAPALASRPARVAFTGMDSDISNRYCILRNPIVAILKVNNRWFHHRKIFHTSFVNHNVKNVKLKKKIAIFLYTTF